MNAPVWFHCLTWALVGLDLALAIAWWQRAAK